MEKKILQKRFTAGYFWDLLRPNCFDFFFNPGRFYCDSKENFILNIILLWINLSR